MKYTTENLRNNTDTAYYGLQTLKGYFLKHIHGRMRRRRTVLTPLSSIHVFKGKLHLPLEVLPRLLPLTERLEDLRRHL